MLRKVFFALTAALGALFFISCQEQPNVPCLYLTEWEYSLDDVTYEPLDSANLNHLQRYIPNRKGYIYLRTTFTVQEPRPLTESYSLYCGLISMASETFMDGRRISKTGEFPPHKFSNGTTCTFIHLPTGLLEKKSGNELKMRIYVEGNGGLSGKPFIGEYRDVENKTGLDNFFHSQLILIGAMFLLFAGLVYLIMYLKMRYDPAMLYFSLTVFSTVIALLPSYIGEFPWLICFMDYDWFLKLFAGVMGMVTVFFAVSFTLNFLKVRQPPFFIMLRVIFLAICVIVCVTTRDTASFVKRMPLAFLLAVGQILFAVPAYVIGRRMRERIMSMIMSGHIPVPKDANVEGPGSLPIGSGGPPPWAKAGAGGPPPWAKGAGGPPPWAKGAGGPPPWVKGAGTATTDASAATGQPADAVAPVDAGTPPLAEAATNAPTGSTIDAVAAAGKPAGAGGPPWAKKGAKAPGAGGPPPWAKGMLGGPPPWAKGGAGGPPPWAKGGAGGPPPWLKGGTPVPPPWLRAAIPLADAIPTPGSDPAAPTGDNASGAPFSAPPGAMPRPDWFTTDENGAADDITRAQMQFYEANTNSTLKQVFLGYSPLLAFFATDIVLRNILGFRHLPYLVIYGLYISLITFLYMLIINFARIREQSETLSKNMREIVSKATAELRQKTTELERQNTINKKDLAMAAQVQKTFYPQNANFLGWDIAVEFRPLSGVSGDLYDFYELEGELRGFGLFDVSGHGISASLVTMLAKNTLFRTFRNTLPLPLNEAILRMNAEIIRNKGNIENYLTGMIFRINSDTPDTIELVNAGNPYPILRTSKGKTQFLKPAVGSEKTQHGMLGLDGIDVQFTTIPFQFRDGDMLIMYTDGLTEAENEKGEQYGRERLIALLSELPDECPSQTVVDAIKTSVNEFIGNTPLDDDLTVLVLRRTEEVAVISSDDDSDGSRKGIDEILEELEAVGE